MIGEYYTTRIPKGREGQVVANKLQTRWTFEMGECGVCKHGGKIAETVVKNSTQAATFKIRSVVPTLYEKTDIDGRRYDRICGKCSRLVNLGYPEEKIAGIQKVIQQ